MGWSALIFTQVVLLQFWCPFLEMLNLNLSGFSLHQVELGYWAVYFLAAMFGKMRPSHELTGQAKEKSKQKII